MLRKTRKFLPCHPQPKSVLVTLIRPPILANFVKDIPI